MDKVQNTLEGLVTISKLVDGELVACSTVTNQVTGSGYTLLSTGYPINAVRFGSNSDQTEWETTDVNEPLGTVDNSNQSNNWYSLSTLEEDDTPMGVIHSYKFLLGQVLLTDNINEVSFGYLDEDDNFTAFNRVVLDEPMEKEDNAYLLFEYRLTINLISWPSITGGFYVGSNYHDVTISTVAFNLDNMRLDEIRPLDYFNVYEIDREEGLDKFTDLSEYVDNKLDVEDWSTKEFEVGDDSIQIRVNKPVDLDNPTPVGQFVMEHFLGSFCFNFNPYLEIPPATNPTLKFSFSWGNIY